MYSTEEGIRVRRGNSGKRKRKKEKERNRKEEKGKVLIKERINSNAKR